MVLRVACRAFPLADIGKVAAENGVIHVCFLAVKLNQAGIGSVQILVVVPKLIAFVFAAAVNFLAVCYVARFSFAFDEGVVSRTRIR